jgi:uncharacterized protein HemX
MTPETDETGSDDGGSRSTQHASPIIAGAGQIPNNSESTGDEVQSARAATPTATGQKDAGFATTVVPVVLGLMLGIAYLGYAHLKSQIEAQHAGFATQLQPLEHKIREMTAAQSQIDAEIAKLVAQSQPPKSEIQGLQNHIITPRGQPKQNKK